MRLRSLRCQLCRYGYNKSQMVGKGRNRKMKWRERESKGNRARFFIWKKNRIWTSCRSCSKNEKRVGLHQGRDIFMVQEILEM